MAETLKRYWAYGTAVLERERETDTNVAMAPTREAAQWLADVLNQRTMLQCCVCSRHFTMSNDTILTEERDLTSGNEEACQLHDGRWACSALCYERASMQYETDGRVVWSYIKERAAALAFDTFMLGLSFLERKLR